MTDGEKKAIDDLFSLTHINGYINLYDQEKANIYTSNLKRWQNGVKVLLNLMQTQQEEINDLKWRNEIYVKSIKSHKSEIEKKDKIIDEMANHIVTSDSNLCQYLDMTTKCKYYAGENKKTCDKCIKEYFIHKVEEEN